MTVLQNNFDTGPNGTAITTSNSGSVAGNNAFDIVGTTLTTTAVYSTAFSRPTAVYTAQLGTGATTDAPCVGWSTSIGSQSQIWFREYVLLTGTPAADATVFECDNGTVYGGFVFIKGGTSQFAFLNSPQTQFITFTTATTLNTWYRLEGRIQFSATAGNWDLSLYANADSNVATETISASNWNLGAATINSFLFGYAFSGTNYPDLYLSGLQLNNTGYPGPAPFRQGLGVPMNNQPNPIAHHVI